MSRCLYCDSWLEEELSWSALVYPKPEMPLCEDCFSRLTLIRGRRCRLCSRSLERLDPNFVKGEECRDCQLWEQDEEWRGVLESSFSLYEYNDFFKEVLARFKYRGDYVLAGIFATVLKASLKRLNYDVAVPIPLSSERLAERGFNQTKALLDTAGIRAEDLLVRMHGEKQSKKTRAERLRLQAIFQLKDGLDISGKTVLLVDDLYTTGSTLRQAARILKKGGAKKVAAITLARS